MLTRKELEKITSNVFINDAVSHISDMLEEIQDYMIRKAKGENAHNSKFIESCANEDWDRANCIADRMNKEALTHHFYQDFVKMVKISEDMRDAKIHRILN